jgi:hypothetical protein
MATRAVKTSCKNTKVRSASGSCVTERPTMKKGGSTFGILSIIAGIDNNPGKTAADRIAGAKMNNKKIKSADSIKKVLPKAQFGTIVKTIAKIAKPVVKIAKPVVKPVVKVVKPKIVSKELSVFQKQRIATGKPVYRGSNLNGNMTMAEIKAKQALQKSVKKTPAKLTKEQQYLKDIEDSYKKNGGTVHPGFKSVQSSIAAKQGISKQAAGAILASSTRKASPKAKAKNPRLKKVK